MRKLWGNTEKHNHGLPLSSPLTSGLVDLTTSPFLTTPPTYPAGSNPLAVALGDFNSDGKQDAIVAANPPMLLLGNGDGTFQAPVPVGTNSFAASGVAVADFNHDGALDVAFATSGATIVYLGNGTGTFGLPITLSSGGNQISAADMNRDGVPDLLVGSPAGLIVLLGNGNGTFQPAKTTAGSAQFMAVGDFNKDGRLDVAVTDGSGNLNILIGKGDGTFTPSATYAGFGPIAIADFNQDQNPDLALATGQLFLGKGNGTFDPAAGFEPGPDSSILAVADLNGDGIPDVMTFGYGTDCGMADFGTAGLSFGNGDGTFQQVRFFDSGGCNFAGPVSVAGGDLNGDGITDLVVLNQGDGLSVLVNRYNPIFLAAELDSESGSGAVAIDDFNRDGNADLILGDGSVYLGSGDGSLHFVASASLDAIAVATGDFNGDGRPDVVAAAECAPTECSTGGQLLISLGNGDGTFQPPATFRSGGFYAESLAVGDFNSDGKLDVAILNNCRDTACSSGGALRIFLGNGKGGFRLGTTITLSPLAQNGFPVSVVAGDFNNDGVIDLVVVGSVPDFRQPGTGSMLLGNGDGTFETPTAFEITTGNGAVAMTTGDFNQDGKLDIALANGAVCADCNGHGSILYGNGDGTFAAGPRIATSGGPPVSVVAADFYGTGALTTILANNCLDTQDCPNGSVFIDGTNNQTDIMLLFLAAGDFNNDGKPDLAGSLQFDPGASVLLNIDAAAEATTTTASPAGLQTYAVSQPVTFAAQIHHTGPGTPTNLVKFFDNGVAIGTAPVNPQGQATITTTALAIGPHFIVPYYSGDSNFAASNSLGVRITIAQATSATAVTSNVNPSYPNQAVTFTANVTSQYGGPVTGSVIFSQGKTAIATASLSNGQALCTTTFTTYGVREITAAYSGDGNDFGSTSVALKQSVDKLPAVTTTTVISSSSDAFIDQSLTFTASVASTFGPIPDGEIVTFYSGAMVIGTGTTAGGQATFSTSSLSTKTHLIKASYPGDGTFKASAGTVQQVVNLYSSTTTLTTNPNPSTKGQVVTLTATVQSNGPLPPAGMVLFKNGSETLGSAKLSGAIATLNTVRLPVGAASITAVYSGDTETGKSTSASVGEAVD